MHAAALRLTPSQALSQFLAALPKVELHIHLVGSASPASIATLAQRHGADDVPADERAVTQWLEFEDFPAFARAYGRVSRLVLDGDDVLHLVMALGQRLAENNVRYAEVTVTPLTHLEVGVEPEALAQALALGAQRVATEHGVELGWIFDISGDLGVDAGVRTLEWIRRYAPTGTLALGLGGPEVGVPRVEFAEVFAQARALGLHSAPHAGETDGPTSVWAAVKHLGAERVGHGIRSVDDAALLAHLAEAGVVLEVCPTSNVKTGATASYDVHPLGDLLAAGVAATLGTDNPGLFATDLVTEYRRCHERLGLETQALLSLVQAGVDGAFCTSSTRARLHREIDAVVDAWRTHGLAR
ncbi:MAG: adenosine deaminase [Pseudomonadota bacterium]